MLDREGIKDSVERQVEKLSELMQAEGRRERVLNGRLSALNNHALLFQNILRADSGVVLGSAETDEVVTIDTEDKSDGLALTWKMWVRVTELPLDRLDATSVLSIVSRGYRLSTKEYDLEIIAKMWLLDLMIE